MLAGVVDGIGKQGPVPFHGHLEIPEEILLDLDVGSDAATAIDHPAAVGVELLLVEAVDFLFGRSLVQFLDLGFVVVRIIVLDILVDGIVSAVPRPVLVDRPAARV